VAALTSLPSFFTLVVWSLPLTQHLSITTLFVSLFLHLRAGHVSAEGLALASVAAIVVFASTTPATSVFSMPPPDPNEALSTRQAARRKQEAQLRAKPLAQPLSYALLALTLLALSPLLRTLTEATTSDSIAALSTALFLLGFALADFSGPDGGSKHRQPGANNLPATLSLNACVFSSIVLASRLPSPTQVFSLILSSICLFAFVPRWSRHHLPCVVVIVASSSSTRHPLGVVGPPIFFTLALCITSSALLAAFSSTAVAANSLAAVFLSLVCPAWMRRAQRWKVGRSGPWDVGVPRIRRQAIHYY
ncbi:GPI2-domain-containing protein, partial [Acaromyces ingoldii]